MSRLLQDIAIGGYIPGESFLHRLDPRVKLVGFLLVSGGILMTSQAAGMLVAFLVIAGLAAACRAGWRIWLSGLFRFVWLLGTVAVVNLLFDPSGEPLLVLGWRLPVSPEGLWSAGMLTFRVAAVIVASLVLTFTTTPTELTRGLQRLAMPLKRLGFPCEEFGVVMLLAMKFIPMLQWELRTTIDAQKSRGVDFGPGGLVFRARTLVSVLVPALVGALRRGDLLAVAMTARGFRMDQPRSEYRPLEFSRLDAAVLVGSVLFFLCQTVLFR